MRPITWFWIAWAIAFLIGEGWAVYRLSYDDTLTAHLRAVMLAHPLATVVVPTFVVGLAIHLLIETLRPMP